MRCEPEHAVSLLEDAGPELLAQAIRGAANDEALLAPSDTARLLADFPRWAIHQDAVTATTTLPRARRVAT
jgi:DNA-binding NarL/FixJ family response regulator